MITTTLRKLVMINCPSLVILIIEYVLYITCVFINNLNDFTFYANDLICLLVKAHRVQHVYVES